MGKIYAVLGKSGSGKDTIFKYLVEQKELKLHTVVTYTTRPIRSGEKDGSEYFFVDEKKLELFRSENKIIEERVYQTVFGPWHYFTVDDGQIALGEMDYIVITTLEGYLKYLDFFGRESVEPLYVEVEDGIRLQRVLEREQKEKNPRYAELCRRFLADEADFSEEKLNQAGINKRYKNIVLKDCLDELAADIHNRKSMIYSI